jgi:hypothetical protein
LASAWRDKVFLCDPWIVDVHAAMQGGTPPPIEQQHPVEFAEFVSYLESTACRDWDWHWARQVDLTFPKSISFTHIGKVETLKATIKVLGEQLRFETALQLPHLNEGIVGPSPKYSSALAARVYALYEEDFATFEYDAKSWTHDREDKPYLISEEHFLNYVINKNRTIRWLANERARLRQELDRERASLRQEYYAVYRFSLARIQNRLRAIIQSYYS